MAPIANNPISPTIDLDADGVGHGFLRLPYSRDDSAWGSVMVPIAVIKNGEGPTALLTGGNHGDEYEGPIALSKLAATLRREDVSGRVIVVPAMNYPAVRAATRTSPIDKGNLNRSFPGRPDGTVTEKIADYFQRTLLPMADVVLDFHSGGKTLEFVPFAATHLLDDKDQQGRCEAAMRAFNAPFSMRLLEIDAVGMYDTAAESMGKTFVSTELGGGGTATARTVRIASRGIRNLLIHSGILSGQMETGPSVELDMPSPDCFCFSEQEGMLEPCVDLGEQIEAGECVARVHSLDRTGVVAQECIARFGGILVGRHFPGLVKTGDCIAVVAKPV
jgi:N-alpha-acetyl-L-2,4-diaminobutyrate deacetylase